MRGNFSIPFKNNTADQSVIPGFAVFQGIYALDNGGMTYFGDQLVLQASQVNANLQRIYYINGPTAIEYGGYSFCSVFLEGPGFALIDDAAGSYKVGSGWGPKPGEWKLFADRNGFELFRGKESTDGIVRAVVRQFPVSEVRGQTTADLTYDGVTRNEANVNVYCGPRSARVDSGFRVKAQDDILTSGQTLPSGSTVVLTFHDGYWWITAVVGCI